MNGETIGFSGLNALLAAGGPVMWVIAVLSVLALAIVLAKIWDCARAGVWHRRRVRRLRAALAAGRPEEALEAIADARDPVSDVVGVVLRARASGQTEEPMLREEVARRGAAWLESLRGGLRPLELIGTLAPLLGLLGTVLGMIEAFRALEAAGSRVDPAVLSGGIWEALLTTAAGLSVAVPAVAAHAALERTLERLHHVMQDLATLAFTGEVATAESEPVEAPARTEGIARVAGAAGAD